MMDAREQQQPQQQQQQKHLRSSTQALVGDVRVRNSKSITALSSSLPFDGDDYNEDDPSQEHQQQELQQLIDEDEAFFQRMKSIIESQAGGGPSNNNSEDGIPILGSRNSNRNYDHEDDHDRLQHDPTDGGGDSRYLQDASRGIAPDVLNGGICQDLQVIDACRSTGVGDMYNKRFEVFGGSCRGSFLSGFPIYKSRSGFVYMYPLSKYPENWNAEEYRGLVRWQIASFHQQSDKTTCRREFSNINQIDFAADGQPYKFFPTISCFDRTGGDLDGFKSSTINIRCNDAVVGPGIPTDPPAVDGGEVDANSDDGGGGGGGGGMSGGAVFAIVAVVLIVIGGLIYFFCKRTKRGEEMLTKRMHRRHRRKQRQDAAKNRSAGDTNADPEQPESWVERQSFKNQLPSAARSNDNDTEIDPTTDDDSPRKDVDDNSSSLASASSEHSDVAPEQVNDDDPANAAAIPLAFATNVSSNNSNNNTPTSPAPKAKPILSSSSSSPTPSSSTTTTTTPTSTPKPSMTRTLSQTIQDQRNKLRSGSRPPTASAAELSPATPKQPVNKYMDSAKMKLPRRASIDPPAKRGVVVPKKRMDNEGKVPSPHTTTSSIASSGGGVPTATTKKPYSAANSFSPKPYSSTKTSSPKPYFSTNRSSSPKRSDDGGKKKATTSSSSGSSNNNSNNKSKKPEEEEDEAIPAGIRDMVNHLSGLLNSFDADDLSDVESSPKSKASTAAPPSLLASPPASPRRSKSPSTVRKPTASNRSRSSTRSRSPQSSVQQRYRSRGRSTSKERRDPNHQPRTVVYPIPKSPSTRNDSIDDDISNIPPAFRSMYSGKSRDGSKGSRSLSPARKPQQGTARKRPVRGDARGKKAKSRSTTASVLGQHSSHGGSGGISKDGGASIKSAPVVSSKDRSRSYSPNPDLRKRINEQQQRKRPARNTSTNSSKTPRSRSALSKSSNHSKTKKPRKKGFVNPLLEEPASSSSNAAGSKPFNRDVTLREDGSIVVSQKKMRNDGSTVTERITYSDKRMAAKHGVDVSHI
eukprot:CAMPEP_0119550886 /NCGR_PEP_ID=MMETSP1352-20130426/4317_1 /TAXON_ID=265584 /ORGANISM="Stauroneis constricta, Strain CCMP1120" /LENGTH=1030 /DNA_ID=CAMNT_0007596863 /DNA_START=403 /DNA_END=3495 /DNA_ORIENTATION=-